MYLDRRSTHSRGNPSAHPARANQPLAAPVVLRDGIGGEEIPVDLSVQDVEPPIGTGPKLYAIFNGLRPGLYDKYVYKH